MGTLWEDYPEFEFKPWIQSIGRIGDPPPERAFWHGKTPQERLRAVEFLRRMVYGYDPDTATISHVVEILTLSNAALRDEKEVTPRRGDAEAQRKTRGKES